MRQTFAFAVALLLPLASPAVAGADKGGPRAVSCETARCAVEAVLEQSCPCDGAINHGQHVRCVARALRQLAADGTIPRRCRGAIVRCAARSICGKPAFVACERPGAICRIAPSMDVCEGAGGTVLDQASCCAACPTTTTTTVTTTTVPDTSTTTTTVP